MPPQNNDDMTKSSEEIFDELVSIRRKLHQIPERGFEEVKTSRFLQETLAGWGIEFRHGIAGTGI
ncbi:amidohydrolase, partial [candidate division KSB1 bacterium]|nr:amidohydrolase [candidate division KSB1 bacterium]